MQTIKKIKSKKNRKYIYIFLSVFFLGIVVATIQFSGFALIAGDGGGGSGENYIPPPEDPLPLPTNPSIIIDSGASTTDRFDVMLTFSCNDALYMKIKLSTDSSYSSWRSYNTQKIITLPEDSYDNPNFQVFVIFGNDVGETSEVSDTIIYIPPEEPSDDEEEEPVLPPPVDEEEDIPRIAESAVPAEFNYLYILIPSLLILPIILYVIYRKKIKK